MSSQSSNNTCGDCKNCQHPKSLQCVLKRTGADTKIIQYFNDLIADEHPMTVISDMIEKTWKEKNAAKKRSLPLGMQ